MLYPLKAILVGNKYSFEFEEVKFNSSELNELMWNIRWFLSHQYSA